MQNMNISSMNKSQVWALIKELQLNNENINWRTSVVVMKELLTKQQQESQQEQQQESQQEQQQESQQESVIDLDDCIENDTDNIIVCGRVKKNTVKTNKIKANKINAIIDYLEQNDFDVKRIGNIIKVQKQIPQNIQQQLAQQLDIFNKQENNLYNNFTQKATGNKSNITEQQYKTFLQQKQDMYKSIETHLQSNIQQLTTLTGSILKYQLQSNNDDINGTFDSLSDMVKYIGEVIGRYKELTEQYNNGQLQLSINLMFPSINVKKMINGVQDNNKSYYNLLQLTRDMGYYIISPNTDKLCVSNVLAYLTILDKHDLNNIGYVNSQIKKLRDEYKVKYEIQDGASITQINEIFKDELIITDYQQIECDYIRDNNVKRFVLISEGHCMLCVNPFYESGMLLKDKIQYFIDEQQQLMKSYEYKENTKKQTINEIIFMDFEWYRYECVNDKGKTFYKEQPYAIEIYDYYNDNVLLQQIDINNIYDNTVNTIINHAYQLNEKYNNIQSVNEIKLNVMAHYMFFADYPIIQKTLINHPNLDKLQGISSGASKIIQPYQLRDTKVIIQFVDFKNYNARSLDAIAKTYGLEVQKDNFPHDLVNKDNYKQLCEEYNVKKYLHKDCQILGMSYDKFRSYWIQSYDIDILKQYIYTQSSLAQKTFFKQYYNNDIYHMKKQDELFCQQGYYGGMTEVFYRGEYPQVQSIDINSSYPGQCVNHDFPIGPYYRQIFNGQQYTGFNLKHGMYKIFIKRCDTFLQFPCIPQKHEGKLVFPHLQNTYTVVSQPEVLKAYQQGYEIYLIESVVSDNVGRPLQNFMNTLYSLRSIYKGLMKFKSQNVVDINKIKQYVNTQCDLPLNINNEQIQQQRQTIIDEYNNQTQQSYDIRQDAMKLLMNSTTGKFAWSQTHEMQDITNDPDYIVKLMVSGKLNDLKQLSDKYIQYTCEVDTKTTYTNFAIISYITAYGRLQLVNMLERLSDCGSKPLYCDTDSVYFSNHTDKFNQYKYEQLLKDEINGSVLGKWKLEMNDNVDQDIADYGIFVCPKMYALKGQNKTKIMGKGVSKMLIDNDERAVQYRTKHNIDQITYDSYKVFLNGNVEQQRLEYKQYQVSSMNNNMRKMEFDNIKQESLLTKIITGQLSKRIVMYSGNTIPLSINNYQQMKTLKQQEDIAQFSTHQQLRDYMEMEVQQIADIYCLFQHDTTHNYYLSLSQDKQFIQEWLKKQSPNSIHQVFGSRISCLMDIEHYYKDVEQRVQKEQQYLDNLKYITQKINKHYGVGDCKWSIVNRSRDTKVSFHLRAPYSVDRLELQNYLLQQVKGLDKIEQSKLHILQEIALSIDLGIYRINGQLRVTDIDYIYHPQNNYIKLQDEALQKLYQQEQKKQDKINALPQSERKQLDVLVQNYMKQTPELVGWKNQNNYCKYKNCIKLYLRRTKQCKTFCKQCNSNHDNDNTMVLTIKSNNISHSCWKYKSD